MMAKFLTNNAVLRLGFCYHLAHDLFSFTVCDCDRGTVRLIFNSHLILVVTQDYLAADLCHFFCEIYVLLHQHL